MLGEGFVYGRMNRGGSLDGNTCDPIAAVIEGAIQEVSDNDKARKVAGDVALFCVKTAAGAIISDEAVDAWNNLKS